MRKSASSSPSPAYLPWFRMGNMSELDGNLTQSWYDKTIALEHKMIDRMNDLGMTPIFNAFAGFVPEAIKRVYPDANLIHTQAGMTARTMSPISFLLKRTCSS